MAKDASFRELHAQGFSEFNEFWTKLDDLENALEVFSETSFDFVEEHIERTLEKIKAFEPAVSVIGQVKAGKSTLLNAMIGETGFLPSDVNPWTSVITNIHLNSRNNPPGTRALFRFFDADEWDRLVETGGRLGEMASRAGFETEADEVRTQVTKMRQSTEERLGDEFQKLLNSSHAFPDIDKSVVDRYICYGDPEDLEDGSTEGVYADLTKSADLYLDLPGYPKGLCLRDTPGVNDTFMMREQITLNAISESRVCLVVLSAHQALSTMDLALLRIICSVEAREVLIFVNRIDELADPKGESEKIRQSIKKTLDRIGLGDDFEIMFGSGYWANCALADKAGEMIPASKAALEAFYGADGIDIKDPADLRQKAMDASGVGELHRAIATRIVEGPGKAILDDVQAETDEIIRMSEMVVEISRTSKGDKQKIDVEALTESFDKLREDVKTDFDREVGTVRYALKKRLENAQKSFVISAVEALQSHIDTFGEHDSWRHDPASLRMMMKSSYNLCCGRLRRAGESSFESVLDGTLDILQFDLDFYEELSGIGFPSQEVHQAPTGLAKTLSLDLQGTWWRRFWRKGSKNAAEKRYRSLIDAETMPLIDMMLEDYFDPAAEKTWNTVSEYLEDQVKFVRAMAGTMGGDKAPASKRDSSAA